MSQFSMRVATAEERQVLLDEIVHDFSREPDVVGIFLAGSLAAGTSGPHSDMDLRVVVAPNALLQFCSNRLSRPEHWPGFLFNEWSQDETCCVSHFEKFLKADVLYLSAVDIRPSPWLALPTIVLHDPTQVIETARSGSMLTTETARAGDIDRAVGKTVAYAIEVGHRLSRGELLYAQSLLDGLRKWLIALEDLLEDRHPGLDCSFKIDERLSPRLYAALCQACPHSEAGQLQRALMLLVPICRDFILQFGNRSTLAHSPTRLIQALDALYAWDVSSMGESEKNEVGSE